MEDRVMTPAGATNEMIASLRRLLPGAHAARMFYVVLAGLFAACIVLQVFFAGVGVLVSPGYWSLHRAFGQTIRWFTIAMLIAGLVGGCPGARWR